MYTTWNMQLKMMNGIGGQRTRKIFQTYPSNQCTSFHLILKLQVFFQIPVTKFGCSNLLEWNWKNTGLSAKNLFTGINIDEFGLNHVEVDTVIFTICNKICGNGWKGTALIDIYAQAAYVSQKVSGELIIKKRNIYVNSRTLFNTAIAHVIMQLHVRTACDHNCGFYVHGKKAVIKKLWKGPKQEFCYMNAVTYFQFQLMYWAILKQLWSNTFMGIRSWDVQRHGQHNGKKWKRRACKDQDQYTLNHICLLANYLAYCQKNFSTKPSSLSSWKWLGNHWWKTSPSEKRFTCIASKFTIIECAEWWRQQW